MRTYPGGRGWGAFRTGFLRELVNHAKGFRGLEDKAFRMVKGGEHFTIVKDLGMGRGDGGGRRAAFQAAADGSCPQGGT